MRTLAPAHEEHWFQTYGRTLSPGKSERFVDEAKALNRWYEVYAFRVACRKAEKVAILLTYYKAQKG